MPKESRELPRNAGFICTLHTADSCLPIQLVCEAFYQTYQRNKRGKDMKIQSSFRQGASSLRFKRPSHHFFCIIVRSVMSQSSTTRHHEGLKQYTGIYYYISGMVKMFVCVCMCRGKCVNKGSTKICSVTTN